MNKEQILERLEQLEKLIVETEPEDDKNFLFSQHAITTKQNIMNIEEERTSTRELVEIMRKSNLIWNVRNRIAAGEIDHTPLIDLESELRDFIDRNEKINAIKHYRHTMEKDFGVKCGLKESKEVVDALASGTMVSLGMSKINVPQVKI
tara:strand:+ start:1116 stop:1562 length:447 start_codon:yes stop_codon:yes gene_type:complete